MGLDKMKILSVIVGLMILLIVPLVLALNEDGLIIKGGKLLITDVDVKVGGKSDKNLDFGESIKHEAKPGDTVEFQIESKNDFTSAEDLEIEDIEVTITIFDIDDGDDLDEDAKEFDLKDGKDKKVRIQFKIPLEVDEDTFDVLVEITGDDENGTSHEVHYELELEVEKEDNEVLFLRNTLTPSEIKCGRTVQLSTAVINTGQDDEDDVMLEVTNVDLGISFRETFDLSNDPFDDDSKFRKTFTFTVDQDVRVGIYSIQSVVNFNDGADTKSETAELVVAQCEIFAVEEEEEEEEVVVVQPPVTQPTDLDVITAGTVTAPSLTVTEEKSLFESTGFLALLIGGEVLLIIIAILIVVAVVRRRND